MVYIMDTTLRDGEQTSGVSFSEVEKLNIAKILLEELRIDYIEVASARVSDGELRGAKKVLDWAKQAGYLERVEILGFVDGKTSLEWISRAGGKVMNLLAKGSLRHVTQQLKKTPEEHLANIKSSLQLAESMGDDDPVDARRVDARLSDARPIDGPMATDARPVDARPPDGSILPPDGGMMGMCTQDTQCPATDCCFGGLMCVPGQRTGLPPPLNCLPN